MMKTIELLVPARNAEYGMEAIRCGADAVYIGAHAYGARSEATNTTEDIKRLTEYAHLFGAKVYVTLNTILYEDELDKVRSLTDELAAIGADALITQDTALIEMRPSLPLHASTQMDNRTPAHARFLHECGFQRIILARELGIKDISDIHRACPEIELEAFVHGALCVSYSGRCYASQYCFGRSANRGECAQFCRLAFDLVDAGGNKIVTDSHLLSLKDMNRSHALEEMIDAGVSSFKIEGRLKDIGYVKNVTAFYRQEIDRIIKRRSDCRRPSHGRSVIGFTPQLQKSFNRGFTDYFLHGRTKDMSSFHTPKSIGEPVGEVKEVYARSFKVAGLATFSNGDGLCFYDQGRHLQGFRVNRVEGNILYPSIMPVGLMPHTPLCRNYDAAFQKTLAKSQTTRLLETDITLTDDADGFTLTMKDESGVESTLHFNHAKETARSPQGDRQKEELGKLGGTVFTPRHINTARSDSFFIPESVLAEWRRQVLKQLLCKHQSKGRASFQDNAAPSSHSCFPEMIDYSHNVSNSMAQKFYMQHGAAHVQPAFELSLPQEPVLMTCRYCLRHAMGMCVKEHHPAASVKEPLYLRLPDGRRFRLKFDCPRCQMLIYADR